MRWVREIDVDEMLSTRKNIETIKKMIKFTDILNQDERQ